MATIMAASGLEPDWHHDRRVGRQGAGLCIKVETVG